ncbi:hypothetical protein AAC387_Pa11g0857 [Persea americana]
MEDRLLRKGPGFHKRWRVLDCPSRALAHTPGWSSPPAPHILAQWNCNQPAVPFNYTCSFHSLTERSSEGQPTHTASGEDGTTGKDRLVKMLQARSVVGLRRGSIA